MIDIIIPLYYNYNLFHSQISNWKKIKGNYKLLFCDNTPIEHSIDLSSFETKNIKIYRNDSCGIDGERHGGVIDYMIKITTSDIICIMDSDFIWIDCDILSYVKEQFKNGYKCLGAELYYDGYEYVNEMYPERHGSFAPCVFGMFIDKQLALSETFVVTAHEGQNEKRETGWRIRQKIINEKIPNITFPSFQFSKQIRMKSPSWFYICNNKIAGLHLLQGSGRNANQTTQMITDHLNIINQ